MSQVNTDPAIKELITIRDFIRWSVTQFNAAELVYGHGTDNAWDEAVYLVLSTLHLPPDTDMNVMDARVLEEEKHLITSYIKRRVDDRIPVPYLVKEAWFAGLSFYVDERVIIPRSPIAELIEDQFKPWLEESQVHNILDLCTGSGCIALSAALVFPNAEVEGIDVSEAALEVAEINKTRMGIENVTFLHSDVFSALSGRKYDIIVSNPPYVSTTEYNQLPKEYAHEPQEALLCNDNGLEIVKRILDTALDHLTPQGILVVEVGSSQAALELAFPQVPFTWLQFERGGEGVFLLTANELRECSSALKYPQ